MFALLAALTDPVAPRPPYSPTYAEGRGKPWRNVNENGREFLNVELTFDREWSVLHPTRHHPQPDFPLSLSVT